MAIEPAAGLVEGFADEVGGELFGEGLGMLVGVSPLSEGHCAAVVPAVDDFGDAGHTTERIEWGLVGDRIDVGFMDFEVFDEIGVFGFGSEPDFGPLQVGFGEEFVVGADGFLSAGFIAFPDGERGAPIAFAGEGPIDVGFEEVAETTIANMFREPANATIVGEHGLFEASGADEPAFAGILDEGVVVGAPAEGVIVEILFLVEEFSFVAEAAGDEFVGIFDPSAGVVGGFGGEFAIGTNGADEFRTLAGLEARLFVGEDFEVDFTEGGREVDESGAGVGGNEGCGHNAPGEAFGLTGDEQPSEVGLGGVVVVEGRSVGFADEIATGDGFEDLEALFDFFGEGRDEDFGDNDLRRAIVDLAVGVGEVWVDSGELVAG